MPSDPNAVTTIAANTDSTIATIARVTHADF
ncbi:Uncharacterised protein [Mycobacteroides abscessus subsp. massiliense]|nr:Uncharacterised protein [Mycobacteroides abscessus subsp. massiliense]